MTDKAEVQGASVVRNGKVLYTLLIKWVHGTVWGLYRESDGQLLAGMVSRGEAMSTGEVALDHYAEGYDAGYLAGQSAGYDEGWNTAVRFMRKMQPEVEAIRALRYLGQPMPADPQPDQADRPLD